MAGPDHGRGASGRRIACSIEEELFYPAVRKAAGRQVMTEADEEHHVAKLLIAELDRMDGSESHFDAKFMVLAESLRHHVQEEEGEMLPKGRAAKGPWSKPPGAGATRRRGRPGGRLPNSRKGAGARTGSGTPAAVRPGGR